MLALVVDDSPTMRNMVKAVLEQIGFDVSTAQDGKRAIKILGNKRMDVIITDINMPNMNGYEFIKEIRSNASYKAVPILILTTESTADAKAEGKAAGASGWIVKPFNPEILINAVSRVCSI